MPSIAGGIFATLWTLTETISSSPGYLGEPIEIAVLKDGAARILEKNELEEHREAIASAREKLRDFRNELEPT
jgi:hypothetical protein